MERVVHRPINGKWDAINYGARFIPDEARVVILNDVDTKIHNFQMVIEEGSHASLMYCDVRVKDGPQVQFYRILNPIRSKIHVAASGELLFIRRALLDKILPIPPCIAEDSYILFKALELGHKARFCSDVYVTTARTQNSVQESRYKQRTTLGIYQALKYTRPTPLIIVFYKFLPLIAPLLMITGSDGRSWSKGIRNAIQANIKHQYPTTF